MRVRSWPFASTTIDRGSEMESKMGKVEAERAWCKSVGKISSLVDRAKRLQKMECHLAILTANSDRAYRLRTPYRILPCIARSVSISHGLRFTDISSQYACLIVQAKGNRLWYPLINFSRCTQLIEGANQILSALLDFNRDQFRKHRPDLFFAFACLHELLSSTHKTCMARNAIAIRCVQLNCLLDPLHQFFLCPCEKTWHAAR